MSTTTIETDPCGARTVPVTVPVTSIAAYRAIIAEVGAAAGALRDAGVERIHVELSIDYEPTTVDYVIRPARDDDDASIPAWISTPAVRAQAERVAHDQLPAAAAALKPCADDAGLVYARRVGGYWHVEPGPPARGVLSSDEDPAAAALHAWAMIGGPRAVDIIVVPATGESLLYRVEDYRLSGGGPYYERVHAFQAILASDSTRGLPDGSDPIVTRIHRARTTGARHASRVRAARAALYQYILDECWEGSDTVAAWVLGVDASLECIEDWHVRVGSAARAYTAEEAAQIVSALVAIELHGVGGRGGISGGSTTTMSWRSRLGKGRRQASDGQAWDAAIREAGGSDYVTPEIALLAVPLVRPIDLEWPMAYALDRAYETRGDAEESRRWCDVARAVMARAKEPGSPSDGPALRLGRRYDVFPELPPLASSAPP